MKKTVIALSAAAVLGIAALAPTAASAAPMNFGFAIHGNGFSIGVGNAYWGGYPGPYIAHQHCKNVWTKVITPVGPKWKKKKVCHWH